MKIRRLKTSCCSCELGDLEHFADETTVFHAEFLIRLSAYPNVRTEPQSDIGHNREKKKDALEETAAEVEKGWLAECSEVDMKQQLNACPSNKKAR